MSNKWIRKGDKVVVIAGNEKGQSGKVRMRTEERIVIEGLNLRKKHVKPKQKMQAGIVELEGPMHISNVRPCNEAGKPVRLRVKQGEDGSKQIVYDDAGQEVVYKQIKKK